MSKKKDEVEEIMDEAKYIVSLESTAKDSNDITFIQYTKYIFTKEYTKTSPLSMPINKKDKKSLKYLKNFVRIIYSLLKEKEDKKNEIYKKELSKDGIGNELYILVENLKTLVEKEKISFDLKEINGSVDFVFSNYLESINKEYNNIISFLNLYFFYLKFFIKSINSFKLILYYFLQITERLKKFKYVEFCPDMESVNCMNLILLFFKNISSASLEELSIYAFVIFKYEYIFRNIDNKVDLPIIQKSIEQTLDIVKEKTLKDELILEYIFSEFVYNIRNNIALAKDKTQIISNCYKNKENNKNKINFGGEINNNIIEKSNLIKNEIKIGEENLEKKDIFDEKTLKGEISTISEDIYKIDLRNNNNSKGGKINNNINEEKEKENNLSNQIIMSQQQKFNSNSENNTENIKNDIHNMDGENAIILENESIKHHEFQNLVKEFNIMKKQNSYLFNKMKRMEEENKLMKTDLEKKIAKLEEKMEGIIKTLDSIQIRDWAKNILLPYEKYLDESDYEKISHKINTKWELISDKIKLHFKEYEDKNNYKCFIEIVEKCVASIERGNNYAHHVEFNNYEPKIKEIIKEKKKNFADPIILFFLLQIKVSDELLFGAYQLLEKFYDGNNNPVSNKEISLDGFLPEKEL